MALGDLSKKYESNGNPSIISSGEGDYGGVSYGMYQLSSTMGSVDEFIDWGLHCGVSNYVNYANQLDNCRPINSPQFKAKWRELGDSPYTNFSSMQHDYIKFAYYDVAVRNLKRAYFNIENHSDAIKDVVWSASVQYGAGEVVELFQSAMSYVPSYQNGWNLSYIDALRFDYDLIVGVYETRKQHPWIWNGNSESIKQALRNRFDNEKRDALVMFERELG